MRADFGTSLIVVFGCMKQSRATGSLKIGRSRRSFKSVSSLSLIVWTMVSTIVGVMRFLLTPSISPAKGGDAKEKDGIESTLSEDALFRMTYRGEGGWSRCALDRGP